MALTPATVFKFLYTHRGWRGFLFDLGLFAVLLIPFHKIPYFTDMALEIRRLFGGKESFPPAFLWFCGLTFFAQGVGALLKWRPFHSRVLREKIEYHGIPGILVFLFLVPHWVFFGFLMLIGTEVMLTTWRWYLLLPLSFLPSVAVAVALKPPKDPDRPVFLAHPWLEHLADALLGSALVAGGVIWDIFVQYWADSKEPFKDFGYTLVWFAIFYTAPRLLFLAEDWRYPRTWWRLALLFLVFVLRLKGWV